jgi:hypothetical protein
LISKYIYLFIYFKGLYITPQKDEMNYIEWLHAEHIFGFDEIKCFWKKVLWIIIIIVIEACVAIDSSKKIKWFIMNAICIFH